MNRSLVSCHNFSTEIWDWIPPIPKPADAAENAEEEQSGKKGYYWDEDVYQADTGDPKTKGWVEVPKAPE